MRRRLLRLGYPAALVARTVERLTALGYLDDAAFARAWVESRDRAHPRGTLALRRELALRGIARDLIDEVLTEREATAPATPGRGDAGSTATPTEGPHAGASTDADARAAGALLERRRRALEREPDPRRRRQRAYALLARSGFDPETCRAAALAFFGSSDEEDAATAS